jgi:hypothetical protein
MAKMGEGAELLPWMRDLRKSLDGCYAYQAEAKGAPSWFQAKEEDDRGLRERVWLIGRGRFRPAPILTGEEDVEETQPSAEAVGSPKKQSFGSKTKGLVAKKVSEIVDKMKFVLATVARLNRRASALESLRDAQETEDSEYQRRMKAATQSETDALDAEDAFQEEQPVARDEWKKVLQERVRKQTDRQMGR